MEVEQVVQLVRRIAVASSATDRATTDPADIRACVVAALDDVRQLTAWTQASQTRLAGRLADVSSFPEKVIADASRSTIADAGRLVERAETLQAFPAMADQLDQGQISAEHIDTIVRAARDLTPQQRDELIAADGQLAQRSTASTVEQFRTVLQSTVRQIVADDGVSRFERQQRATRLRTWVDKDSGMGRIAGQFDPLTYLRLATRLDEAVDALFATATPATCPTDPLAKQDHLRALALASLVESPAGNAPGRAGRAEFVVVVDTRTSVDQTDPSERRGDPSSPLPSAPGAIVDFGLPIEIPRHVLDLLARTADVHTVVVNGGIVLHAPGQLDLQRTTRIANRAQRRALRSLHPTCAVPGCRVRFDNCDIHHVIWWRNGGATNLNNLIPICSHHHHAVHDLGWVLHLDEHRRLTITLPDGTTMTTGPPTRRAA